MRRLPGWLPSLIVKPFMAVVVVASLATVGMSIGVLNSPVPASAETTTPGSASPAPAETTNPDSPAETTPPGPDEVGGAGIPNTSCGNNPSTVLNGGFTTGGMTLYLQKHEEASSTQLTNPGTGYRDEIAPNTEVTGEFSYCTSQTYKGANTTAWYRIDNGPYVVKAKSEAGTTFAHASSCEIQRSNADVEVNDSPYKCRSNIVTLGGPDKNKVNQLVAVRFYVSEKPGQTIDSNSPANQRRQQDLLERYCGDKNNPACSYVVTGPKPVPVITDPPVPFGQSISNCTTNILTRDVTREKIVSSEDTIGLSLTSSAGFDAYIFKVSMSATATYSTKFSTSEKISDRQTVTVPRGQDQLRDYRCQIRPHQR